MKPPSLNRGIASVWVPVLGLVVGIVFGVVARDATHDDASAWPGVEAIVPHVHGNVIDWVMSPSPAAGAHRKPALVQT
ncbi:MAG: hypothetical protein ABI881_12825 [Betaproteobacteria bacterium]